LLIKFLKLQRAVNKMPKAYALIPAAGSGSRVGAAVPKQYLEIAGRPLLHHAVRSLARHPRIEQVLVVLAQGDERYARCDWREFDGRVEPLYCGGETRAATVFNGLLAARDTVSTEDWVLVHDAARPCLGREELDRLFGEVAETGSRASRGPSRATTCGSRRRRRCSATGCSSRRCARRIPRSRPTRLAPSRPWA
jgi:2-C-methyl-D-erythritol 4-phosphate cytidylyltransferase